MSSPILLAGALALAAWSTPAEAAVLRHALVIGANDGGLELEQLKHAETDAAKMRDVLVELGGFEPAAVTTMMGPTVDAVQSELELVSRLIDEDDEVLFLFYYSGHADARGLRLGEELYDYERLKVDVEALHADVTLGILDACRSGAITNLKGASVVDPFLGPELDAEGQAWITASSADEKAQESDRIQGSFFTHYLVSGMRGAADTGDGRVSLNEAYLYAYERTVTRTGATDGGTQHPEYDFQLTGQGDLELTVLSRATSRVVFPETMSGQIMVISEPEGWFVAEVNKIEGQPLALALQPGVYKLRRRQDGLIYEVRIGVEDGSIVQVPRDWGVARAEESGWKGVTVEAPEDVVEEPDSPEQVAAHVVERAKDAKEFSQDTLDRAKTLQLEGNPRLATGLSALTPGAGQFYNGQYIKGAFFLGGAYTTLGTSVAARSLATGSGLNVPGTTVFSLAGGGNAFSGSITGRSGLSPIGWGIYGASIAQAASFYRDPEEVRPRKGVTLSTETAWWNDAWNPHTAGFAADLMLGNGMSVGLDRTGWTRSEVTEEGVFHIGGRVMYAPEQWDRLRPGLFVASGLRSGEYVEGQTGTRFVIAGGSNVRWYITPRYFVNYELRYELDGGQGRLTNGGGIGVHLGG